MLRITAAQARAMGIKTSSDRTSKEKPEHNILPPTPKTRAKKTKGRAKRRKTEERKRRQACQWEVGTFPGGIWLQIPEIPPSLNVWQNWHPMKRHRYKKELAGAIKLLALAAGRPGYRLATVQIIYYFPDARPRDIIDNYCPKFLMDALVNAGILDDDRSGWVEVPRPESRMDRKKPRTEVFVWGRDMVKKDNRKYQYDKNNCPKSMRWLEQGGRCGWAHECDKCRENPNK